MQVLVDANDSGDEHEKNSTLLQTDSFAGPWLYHDDATVLTSITRGDMKQLILSVLVDADERLGSVKHSSTAYRWLLAYLEGVWFLVVWLVFPNLMSGDNNPLHLSPGILLTGLVWAFIAKRATRFECSERMISGWTPYVFRTLVGATRMALIVFVLSSVVGFLFNRV